jgi:acyl carrier protein
LSREEILEALSGVFEEVLGRPVNLGEETTGADVEGWDSVTHVMLILASERRFGVRFESSEIANAANVGEFVSLIESKQG